MFMFYVISQRELMCIFQFFFLSLENQSISMEDESQAFDAREEPDGEETIARNAQPQVQATALSPGCTGTVSISNAVKVPNWILAETTLEVLFNERATQQIDEFQINRVSVYRFIIINETNQTK